MRVDKINNTKFEARFVNNVRIGELVKNSSSSYFPKKVSFVEILPSDSVDINALEMCLRHWDNADFTSNIYYAACAVRNGSKYYKNHNIYALTTQDNEYSYLDGGQILGLVHTSPYYDGSTLIEHIQANPKIINDVKPEYKRIGTGILKSLKYLTNKITSFPSRAKSQKNFFILNGFMKHPTLIGAYIWDKSHNI